MEPGPAQAEIVYFVLYKLAQFSSFYVDSFLKFLTQTKGRKSAFWWQKNREAFRMYVMFTSGQIKTSFLSGTIKNIFIITVNLAIYPVQGCIIGAISTAHHSSSELRVIRTNAHRVDSYFLHLFMHLI